MTSDTEFLTEFELAGVHFTFICFMVITTKMQEPVKNELLDLVLKRESVFFGLSSGLLGRDHDIAEVTCVLVEFVRLVGEREYIGRRTFTAEQTVELSHAPIGNERHGEVPAFQFIYGLIEAIRECLKNPT